MCFDLGWNIGLTDMWSALTLSQNSCSGFAKGMPKSRRRNMINVISAVVETDLDSTSVLDRELWVVS